MLLHDKVAYEPEAPIGEIDEHTASPEPIEREVVTPMPALALDQPASEAEDRLWPRVVGGLAVGFVAVTVLAFAMLSLIQPDVPLVGRLGFAAYIGFWSSPFVGFSAAVGYHQLTEAEH